MNELKMIEAISDILENTDGDQFAIEAAKEIFSTLKKGGFNFNCSWVDIKNALPENSLEVICFNKEWVNVDFNPSGTRIGFLNGDNEFTTAHWWDYQDTYITISKNECDHDPQAFSDQIKNNTEPTHWILIPGTNGLTTTTGESL